MPLTHTGINKLQPSSTSIDTKRPDKHSDGNGLQLWVRYTGVKSWISAYRWQGKQQTLTIGTYPVMSLQNARQRNIEIKRLIADGVNPKDDRKKTQADNDGSRVFDTIAQRWHDDRKAHIAPTTYSRDYSQYQRDIKPFIGHMNIEDIIAPDVLAIGKAIEARGAGDMARRAMRQTGQIFKQAIREGLTNLNPANDLTEALKPHKVKHHSRITSQQLPKLLHDINTYEGDVLIKLGLWFMCYTFVRTQELRFMEWSEIDYKAKIWRIPAEKMKMDRPHLVPLAPQTMAILEQIKALGFSDKYVFFNPSTRKPYSMNGFITALWRMGYKGKMTGHGFRALASTTLHENNYKHEAIELQLAHEKENKISAAYNGAQYLHYRINMMNKWADFISDVYAGKPAKEVYTKFRMPVEYDDY
ncbi:tyrosine-type recombinase/integrase [Psychrobacter sp. ANT_H59]|uniref:tyrosine-type recombinase/integrase n=1 Tax=Psychrobacter sp. ANT_H59 TaxID=2597354 RepID=UPI0011EF632A|nr:integrase arm-type DNA-binding domain-containing protein [Psychrobacter sp. ANT_H59]KAA0932901.1 tyrosine-type recombinase/integrase [Psychrobacter sp. ANT_H59]